MNTTLNNNTISSRRGNRNPTYSKEGALFESVAHACQVPWLKKKQLLRKEKIDRSIEKRNEMKEKNYILIILGECVNGSIIVPGAGRENIGK